jgi:WD40 repeat protein
MNATRYPRLSAVLMLLLASAPVFAQEQALLPPGNKEPVLRLEPEGPTALVTALTFSNDGKRLYAAGFDKLVRVWVQNADNKFELDKATYRVPIGPGVDGTINAMALSPDEKWLAVAGAGIVRGAADFRIPGVVLPKTGGMTKTMWEDRGIIYVFNTRDQSVRILRGHMGPVWALTFAPAAAGKPALLVSAGRDRNMTTGTYRGSLRVWDVDKGGEPLATRLDLPALVTRPGLTAWHVGAQNNQLRVATAWNDGNLRVWDVASNQLEVTNEGGEAKDGRSNVTAIYLPDREQVFTTTMRASVPGKGARAQIRRWNVTNVKPVSAGAVSLDPKYGLEPLGAAFVSSRPGGKADHLAMTVRKSGEGDNINLLLVDITQDGFGTVDQAIMELWPTMGKMPVIAGVPGGRFLAIAGNYYHSIRAYSVGDILVKGSKAKPQFFKGVGTAFSFVAFVRNGQDRGLVLREYEEGIEPALGKRPRQPAKGDVIFNFTTREFTADLDGWQIDAPGLGGWTLEHTQLKREGGTITAPSTVVAAHGDAATRIRLPAGELVSDYAILPAMKPWNVAILAVASHELDQPWLRLYNAETGEQLRQYQGHHYKVHGLAFSGDGRFLVSTGDDSTTCVYSLELLDKIIGKQGLLPGTAFRNQIVVQSAPAAGQLQAYDVIEGILDADNKLHRFSSLEEIYSRVGAAKAGTKITLRVRNEKGNERDVQLDANTALVERNRAILLGLGLQNPAAVANLRNASRLYSPIPGVVLKYAPTVALTPEQSPLTRGDVIEGIDQNKKLRPLANAFDLYEAIALTAPKANLQLRVRGKGNVPVAVGQGADDRKPLFFLFVVGGSKVNQWDWVGWSPIGPYESSGRRAERYVGWHFNTGDPAAPARFALIDEYRKEYYRDGILRFLMARASLAPALKDWQDQKRGEGLPRPKMTLYADEVGPDPEKRNGLGQVVVRQNPIVVKLAVDDFPAEHIDGLFYQVDGGPLERFADAASARERSTALNLSRGVHTIRTVLRTNEAQPQEYTRDLVVRVVPPAPLVKAGIVPRQVNNAAFAWQAKIAAGQPGQAVEVRLGQKHNGKEIYQKQWQLKGAATLDVADKLELKPGDNQIEVSASNADAPKADADLEIERRVWVIHYVPPAVKVAPPRITLVRVLGGLAEEPQVQAIQIGKPVIVTSPSLRVEGRIDADEPLATATVTVQGKPARLAQLAAKEKLTFVQPVELQPGTQTLIFKAKTATSDEASSQIDIEFRPPLPRLVLRGPDQPIYEDAKRAGAPEAPIQGTYLSTSEVPFEATLLVNDRELMPVPTREVEWTKRVPLKAAAGEPIPIENRIQVRLKSKYGVYTTEPVMVRYLRPPHDIHFDEEPRQEPKELHTRTLLVDLTARVQSHLPLIRESVAVEVNGREVPSIELLPVRAGQPFGIKINNLPLEPNKKNLVKVWVSNPEARCRAPGILTLVYDPPPKVKPPTPPDVTIVEPAQNVNVTDPAVPVRFRVQNPGKLKRLSIVREGQKEERIELNPDDFKVNDDGAVEVRRAVNVQPGVNRLRVVAVNDGGEQESAVVLNYPRMPVRLVIDDVTAPGGASIKPRALAEGKLVFGDAPKGQMLLNGRVTWSKEDDEQIKKIGVVRIYVNGFQQIPAELRPAEGNSRERKFTARLVLNREKDNEIEVELPDLKQDQANRNQRRFALNCAAPQPGQRLHLLVVGIGEEDGKKLVDEALLSVRAKADKDGVLRAPAFSQVRVYGPLTRFVKPDDVYTQMCLIKKTIDLLASEDSPNDVVMIYYKGGESVSSDGNYFTTSATKYDKNLQNSGITYRGIQECFGETLGAKVLLLDVSRMNAAASKARDDVAEAKDAPTYFGVLRYQWRHDGSSRQSSDLMQDWKTALANKDVEVLRAATVQLSNLFKTRSSELAFDRFVPAGLADLMVDRKKGIRE